MTCDVRTMSRARLRDTPWSHAVLLVLGVMSAGCDASNTTTDDGARSDGPGDGSALTDAPSPSSPPPSPGDASLLTPDGSDGSSPPSPPVIAPAIAALVNDLAVRSPGTELGIAVFDFVTKEYASSNEDIPHVSASSPKAIWVAAALDKVGIAEVTPYAKPIFESSSNSAATSVIELAGPNYINDFYAKAGMTKSAFTQWSGQVATNSPKALGSDNYITAKDGVSFLKGIHDGVLLDMANNAKLEEWMTWSPRSGFGGWLGTLLPASAQSSMMHKAGWLPPPYDERCVNEIGLVEAAPNHWYAITILARYGNDYDVEQQLVEHASCVVFKAIAADTSLDCK